MRILRKSDIKGFFFSCVFYFFIFISLPLLAPLETRRFCHVDSSDLKAIRRNEIGEYTLVWDIGDRKLIWRMPIYERSSALITHFSMNINQHTLSLYNACTLTNFFIISVMVLFPLLLKYLNKYCQFLVFVNLQHIIF